MVKMGFSTILLFCQRLHVKEYHKTQKYLSNARQAMEVFEKAPSQKAKSEEAWASPRSIIALFWMASGMSCGPAANGSQLRKNGLAFPVVFSMSGSRPGRKAVCSHCSSKRWSNTMLGNAKLVGNGNLWIA